MIAELGESERFSTAEVAKLAGVHKDTLLRWLRAGLVSEPSRNRHGWRSFTRSDARAVIAFASSGVESAQTIVGNREPPERLTSLESIDWDFPAVKTSYLTHGIHPYPAKFIPQIPNALIQELSSVGDVVADIFCGSGTTLVEAITLKRHAIGIDANPLACLISRAKTGLISKHDRSALLRIVGRSREKVELFAESSEDDSTCFLSKGWRPKGDTLHFWFDSLVIEELAECLSWCYGLRTKASCNLALTAFSSIVVSVSKQDSDTRYVRREKGIIRGEVFRRFSRALEQAIKAADKFSELAEERFSCSVIETDILSRPDIASLDLVVCSPPYPNAYSYHLYHMTRMLWLGMDQPRFKKEEIGSHRKYSNPSKNSANANTFRKEFSIILNWLVTRLKKDRYACFVVGDSTLKGDKINNADLISQTSKDSGFVEVHRIYRTIQTTKKAFNPSIGKIKTEAILILQNRRGT